MTKFDKDLEQFKKEQLKKIEELIINTEKKHEKKFDEYIEPRVIKKYQ
jgi:rubrerythrin